MIVLFLLFFLSGAASLIYEVVWMRDLTLIIGATTYAVATILSTFMGGLALGALLFGRWADRFSRPLLIYALLEVGIGLYALVIPSLFGAARTLYVLLYGLDLSHPSLSFTRALLAGLVLLPPTVLMGGTLPVLASFLIRRRGEIGRSVGLLYFVNTAGAVVGCTLAGFLLIEHLGLLGTTRIAAATNFTLAVIAVAVDRILRQPMGAAQRTSSGHPTFPVVSQSAARLSLYCIGISGFVSLAYEVLWTRALLRYLYNSTYAFTTMLAVFLAGLALGSWVSVVLPYRKTRPIRLFAALEVGAGAGFLLSALLFADLRDASSFILNESVLGSFRDSLEALVLRSALILFLPAVFLGATVPIATEICARRFATAGRAVGNVYAINTVGAILGSLAAAFLMIPAIGMQGTLTLLVSTNFALALALAVVELESRTRRLAVASTLAVMFFTAVLVIPPDLFRRTFVPAPDDRLIFYKEGATDTVGVIERDGQRFIVYGDLRGTAATFTYPWNYVFGHLPVLLHPGEPENALHICFGVGNSLSALAAHASIREIDSVELSPHVLDVARYFWSNNGVIENPKVHTIIDDGRNFVMATRKTYDIIELEPPETFTAGVVYLYTREFYEDIAARLADDGVFVQWVPVGEAPIEQEKMLFRAFYEVFPHGTVWQELFRDGPILLVGTKGPLRIDYQLLREKMQRPRVREDLEMSGIKSVEGFLSMFIFSSLALGEFVDGVEPVVDDRTVVDFTMPRYIGSGFGMGTFTLDAREDDLFPFGVALQRGLFYYDRRGSVAPLLTNLEDEDLQQLEARIFEHERPTTEERAKPIPEVAWRRWEGVRED